MAHFSSPSTERKSMRKFALFTGLLLVMLMPARGQDLPDDSLRVYELESIVVTADRAERTLARTAAAVSVVRRGAFDALPVATLTDALSLTPGLVFFNRDGLGNDPIASVRGFYGGGEVSYLLVLVDGMPQNDVETGLVNWNALTMEHVENIEILRGGASSLYGDAALGGVINLITRRMAPPSRTLSISGGTFNTLTARFHTTGSWNGRRFSLYGDVDRTDGYRTHGERSVTNLGGSFALLERPTGRLSLATDHHWKRADDPGYLAASAVADDPRTSSDFFRFDRTEENRHRLSLDGAWQPSDEATVSAFVSGELRSADVVRTLLLSPEFADTKDRDLTTKRLSASAQVVYEGVPLPFPTRLTAGVDAGVGRVDNAYYLFLTGPLPAYLEAPGVRGDLDAKGTGDRTTLAAFAQYELTPVPALTLTLGGRYDHLRDTYTPEAPSTGGASDATHTAFSPRAGVNVRYVNADGHEGHVYASAGRSFKAPTLDQLYDQRATPVPFPPYAITISNGALKPQRGTNVEAGIYHRAALTPGGLTGELSLSVYRMDMEDEVDFDLQQFRYVNLGKSRHTGVESGLKLYFPGGVTTFVNYAVQSATQQSGAFEGNFLKAVPRDVVSGGLTYRPTSGLGGALTVRSVRRVFLDDANTIRLPNHTTADARVSYRLKKLTVTAEVFNLTNEAYSTTGFPDPAGSDVLFLYPAAERTLRLGVDVRF